MRESDEWPWELERRARRTSPESKFVPERFLGKTLERFDPGRSPSACRALATVRNYVETFPERRSDGQGLLLRGPVGSGKTHLAVAIVLALPDVWSAFIDTKLLIRKLKDSIDDPDAGGKEMLRAARTRRLVVLDDLAADDGKPSEFVLDTLGDVIRHRYNRCLPLIVTTNRKEEKLESYITTPLVSRLAEMCRTIDLVAADARRK